MPYEMTKECHIADNTHWMTATFKLFGSSSVIF